MKNRGVKIVYTNPTLHGFVAHVIRGAVHGSAFDATASHPHSETCRSMIAAGILLFPRLDLGKRQSPELAAPDDQRTVVQPALFEVRQQSAHRPIGLSTAV